MLYTSFQFDRCHRLDSCWLCALKDVVPQAERFSFSFFAFTWNCKHSNIERYNICYSKQINYINANDGIFGCIPSVFHLINTPAVFDAWTCISSCIKIIISRRTPNRKTPIFHIFFFFSWFLLYSFCLSLSSIFNELQMCALHNGIITSNEWSSIFNTSLVCVPIQFDATHFGSE